MKKIWLIGGISALLLVIILFFAFRQTNVKYSTKEIKKESIVQYVEASGTIKPINTIAVGTQVSGTVAKIYVDYNDNVKQGDLLA